MLDAKDLEMIAEVVARAVEPVHKDVIGLQREMAAVKEDMAVMKGEIKDLQKNMTLMRVDMTVMKKEIGDLQKNIRSIQLVLEGDVRDRINIIGEGHLALARNLNQALENKEERELIKVRVLYLENEMRRIKGKLGIA